jgi:NAD(P)-dependent dehydrogenase (short-subunit alcohol dehydrogenase family)
MSEKNQLAVVTGASSGCGEATAQELAARGFHVLAGVRQQADADRLAADGIEPVILDVTDTEQVAAIAERVASDADGRPLAVLVNNAGIAVNAPVETLPMEGWRRQLEVNFFGQLAVTQALLPALLAARGRVVNVSSIGGRVAGPTYGAYSASKFALEAMSDALRREAGRFGLEVIVVEPGTVATPIWDKGRATAEQLVADMSEEQRARYADLLAAVFAQAEDAEETGIHPSEVARVIADAVEARRPRTRYLVGRDAKVMVRLAGMLPDRVVDRLVARTLGIGESREAGGEAPVTSAADADGRRSSSGLHAS